MNDRYDFPAKAKKEIAGRAGYRCSFTGCNALLIGPNGDTSIELGECAHIYAAAGQGPRGQAGLSEEAIKSVENGIYLCHEHHKLIDSAEGCAKYDAQTLLQMKEAHEYRISCEIGIQQRPMTRIKSITFLKHPFFAANSTYNLTKTTVLQGGNGSGKSALIESLNTILTGEESHRWQNDDIEALVMMDNPVKQVIRYEYHERVSQYYDAENRPIGFCPFDIEVFYLHNHNMSFSPGLDDFKTIAHQLGISEAKVRTMVDAVELVDPIMASQAAIAIVVDDEGKEHESLMLKMYCGGNLRHYFQLSTSQQNGFLLDLVSGYMRRVAKYKHALLLIDWDSFCTFDDHWKNQYFAALQKTGNNVQTIITTPHPLDNINVGGWNIISM